MKLIDKYIQKVLNESPIGTGSFSSLAGSGGMPADGKLTPSNYWGTNDPIKRKKKKKKKKKSLMPMQRRKIADKSPEIIKNIP